MSWGMRATPARKARDAKRRDELQTKIEEDKLLEFQMACDDGDPDGCFSLAEWHAIVAKDHAKAASMFMENCLTRSHGASCHHSGLLHVNGRGVKRSQSKALQYMQRACAVEHPDGCGVGGMLAMRRVRRMAARQAAGTSSSAPSASVLEDAGAALKMLQQGCELGCATACSYLGGLLVGGDASVGIAPRPQDAVPPLRTGCEANDGSACHNLAILLRNGADGVAADTRQADELLARAKEIFASTKGKRR